MIKRHATFIQNIYHNGHLYPTHIRTRRKERNLVQTPTLKSIKAAVTVPQNQLHRHEKTVREGRVG